MRIIYLVEKLIKLSEDRLKMGFLPSSIRLLIKLHKKYSFEGPVLTLGNQDIWATHKDLSSYFQEMNVPFDEPEKIISHSSRMFKQNIELKKFSENFVHARVFFEMMGIKEYWDMDKFDYDVPIFRHDLNYPIPPELQKKFSLIIDGGTIEHIFDVRSVMENIINMLKPGGCVMHISSFNMDHGLYAFSPIFFFDFYKANEFTDFSCYILQIDNKKTRKTYSKHYPYFEYTYGMSLKGLIKNEKEILIFFVARQKETVTPMIIPTQGIFEPNNVLKSINNNVIRSKYSYESLVPKLFRPVFQPLRYSVLWFKSHINQYKERRRIKKGFI